MSEQTPDTTLPQFVPALESFRAEEFLALTESLLAVPIRHAESVLRAAAFRLSAPETVSETPLSPLPPRWYPRPAPDVIAAAREALTPPKRPPVLEGRTTELERVLRPLVAGHSMCLHGEPGIGKSTLLALLATHERTRRRFRHVFWIDRPDQLAQTLALALNLPHILMETDPDRQLEKIAGHLDDHMLLVVDNLTPDGIAFETLAAVLPHVLAAVETPPEVLDPDEPPPDDPEPVVTLRPLTPGDGADALALHAGIDDTRRIRPQLARIARALGGFPLSLALAGAFIRHDELPLEAIDDLLDLESLAVNDGGDPDESDDQPPEPPHAAGLRRIVAQSLSALPTAYRDLLDAFMVFPPGAAPLDGLQHVANLDNPLACRRALITLERYGLVARDHRDPERYTCHLALRALIAAAMPGTPDTDPGTDAGDTPAAPGRDQARRVVNWALAFSRDHADHARALYHAEPALVHALAQPAATAHQRDALRDALRDYLREYRPDVLTEDERHSMPPLSGLRAEAAQLTQNGIEATSSGAVATAEEALTRALEIREEHDSPHALAETLVALGRLYDGQGRYTDAEKALVRAAELVYELGADDSLSVVRRGLARVYRHMHRHVDALAVLDDAPEAHRERAAILRAQGHYEEAVEEMRQAPDATPYARAEIYLLAGHYAEALQAIEEHDDPHSALLRAQVYHLQGAHDEAIRAYHIALDACNGDAYAEARIYRGLGAALAQAEQYDDARDALETALDRLHHCDAATPPDHGRTLRLLAAVHLAEGDHERAADTARQALDRFEHVHAPDDIADTYRTLGRALWQQGDALSALQAFQGEADHAQSMAHRDETRIGIAFQHLAEAYRATGAADRATANYRLAISHVKPARDPHAYFITQLGLHRVLVEGERLTHALDLTQEMFDHLEAHPPVDLGQLGYALALRTRTQQALERPIRANQTLHEWAAILTTRAEDALTDPRPALAVLVLGLAVRSLLADGRPSPALPLAEQALEIAREHFPDSLPTWAATRDLGEVHMALGHHEEAILTLDPLLDNAVKDAPPTYALAQAITGRAYRAIDEPENALAHLRSALEWEPDAHIRALTYETIGDIQRELGRLPDAADSYRAAEALLDPKTHAPDAARVLTTLAETLGSLNRYGEAVRVYEDALVVLRDVETTSPTHTAGVLTSLGQTHEAQGQLADAARAYRRALNILERSDAPRQTRDLMHRLSRASAQMGDPNAALLYEQTIALTEACGEPHELGEALCELGDVHRDADRLLPAIQYYQSALEHQPSDGYPRQRVNTLRNLGRALVGLERYDEATQAWSEAIALSQHLPDESPQEIALTYHAIAEAHRQQQHYANAARSYREALKHHKANTVEIAATWRSLGQTLHATGHYDEAAKALRYALEAEKAQPQLANARLVQTLQSLAAALEAGDLPKDAIARHHEALVYMDRDLQPDAYADTLRKLAALYAKQPDWTQAHKALQEALAIENAQRPRRDERIASTLKAIADLYRAQGLLEKAAETYQKVTVYTNIATRASDDLRDTLSELERRRATLQAAQQSLALLDRSEANLKDLAFIYALIARSHAGLNQPEASADAINDLLDVLELQDDLLTDEADPDYRALAWLREATLAQQDDDIAAARQACDHAAEAVANNNLRWVIGQYARALADAARAGDEHADNEAHAGEHPDETPNEAETEQPEDAAHTPEG